MWRRTAMVVAIAVAAMAAALVTATGTAASDGPEVIRAGGCSGGSDWKLKVKREDGGLEVEYEVDQNVSGQKWRVALRHNGVRFFKRIRTTHGPSGSFEVERIVANKAGADRFRARARNLSTGELCKGRATF